MHKRIIYALVLIAILVPSCSVSEEIAINKTDASSRTVLDVEPFFIDVLSDFSDFLPDSNESLMDTSVRLFAETIDASTASDNVTMQKTGEYSYELGFSFKDADDFISSLSSGSSGTLINQNENSFSFHLDMDNYEELKRIVPFLADQNFEVYGPEFNQGMSEDEYIEMMYYLLGEEAPEAIRSGMVSISLTVPGTITETVNAEIIDDNTAVYSFPIIDFLLLASPIDFSIEWN